MIWLTWRQHRRAALVFGAVVALLAAYFVITGVLFYRAYDQVVGGVSVAACLRQPTPNCSGLISGFLQTYFPVAQLGLFALAILPALVGAFLGAPLVARELENGTFRLAWTQSVTRSRWLVVSCAVVIGVVALACALFIPLARWWGIPLALGYGLGDELYDFSGPAYVAYLLFALTVGVAAGALLRRAIPAMFATLVGYVVVRLPIEQWVRPYLITPLTATWNSFVSSGPTTISNQDWVLYNGYLDQAGKQVDSATVYGVCAPSGSVDMRPGSAFTACVHAHGWLSTMIWQPASRYWLFQGIESAIFVALAAALLALTFWWVRRRIA